ncbi:uncharacterized protein JCM6883_002103 [Sporobolomyces salmoneus]|uniref:uncharacterized protein n=1 Tax=Sporobolomyces salmoneus TaxID=183962 RepID=UPI00316F7FD0
MSDDPARTFFPGSDPIPSLYSVLSVPEDASPEDLKRSYRRLSLLSHPDKASSSGLSPEEATRKFQQIGFAYSVLKDQARRERYDRTGSTEEGSSGEGAKTEAEWRDYFKELWQGEVTGESIEEFRKKYQGSEEETQDLYDAYNTSQGDLELILSSIMCSTDSDETRFIELINSAISSGQLEETKKWKKTSKDTKGRGERKKRAEKEAKEAEKLAKELGVHDKLYGGNGSSKSKGKGKGKQNQEEEGEGEGDGDEAALKALIQGNRNKRMNSLVDSLEAKYGGQSGGGKKKRGSTGGDAEGKSKKKKEEEPTEDEFARIQAELMAGKIAKAVDKATGTTKSKAKSGKKSK